MQAKKIIFLNREEVEEIEKIIEKNYGVKISLEKFVVGKGRDEKIWIVSKKILDFDFSRLNINSFGLNLGKLKKNEKIHLTIEGCEMVGNLAIKNVVILDEKNAIKFMQGLDVEPNKKVNCEHQNFVIVKFGEKILGSGFLTNQRLKSMVPKGRRMSFIL